ncbi:MAG: leucine-rich repeat protein [Moorea sp. SIOASIH]|uniref:leucine-rich repeat domain-containing protein n=1 Tax=Moorena sp. SIOASIH TaxID=2607817 RepID=UPI0013BB48B1|nr:COR domain-containing protein [Moorena sp. SIOASIH]NEO37599.1 leucine-rich repeat protein [Moorena sp. SIOASIH]
MPDNINDISNLNQLDLSDNKLNKLPESIGNISNLTRLDLSSNQLTSLPESIGNISNLTRLDLWSNQLNNLPESIGNISNLTRLDLSFNQLTKLPESIGNLSNLTRLDLSRNQLTNLSESFGNFSKLTLLSLSVNQLTKLPDSIGNISNLTELNLSRNQLNNLPKSLGNYSNLILLLLQSNQLKNLPESLGNLSNLTTLDLSDNQLTNLPESLENLSNLTELYLSENKLNNLPESLGNLSNLTTLDLSDNQLTNLPESLGNLSNLTELDLSANQLTNLPESLGNLSNLTRLYLSSNQLTNLPESLGNLSNLARLYLWHNQLTNLPKSLGNLFNLAELSLRTNQLTKLPESLGNLSNLTKLSLRTNQLTKLPESLGNISNLTNLDLSINQLTKLPESLGNLSNLTELDLEKNQLTHLPESLGNLSNLTKLDLSGNPLVVPPPEVVSKGVDAIKQYLRQLREEGKDYIYEAKLLIVGEAGAGKTSLAKKIQDCEYQLQDNQKSTKGIDVIKWSFPLDNEREFKVNIWDFGGQEIYHATHQFFLTKRSLYTLVADSRKEDTDFYYWLNSVEQFSDNSPLLIIKNEKQDRRREINERALRGQFTNLEKTLATNLKTDRGLPEIIGAIQYHIQNLPHVGQALPKTWVKVRQALENDSRDYISLEEYLDICETNGFTLLEDKLQLSGYLHDLGVCLHFQDQEDSLLYKTAILKPEWGTYAVYKVLDNPNVKNNKGKFTRKDLKRIWKDDKYASRRGELLELMKKFQLCYEIPDCKDTLIAPQLLSDNQPDYNWNPSHNLILRYTYPDFMPKGIITRFIVVMHQYIDQQEYVWKSGVILTKDKTKAEVIEYYGKRQIQIKVYGKHKRELLTIVAYELDRINAYYNRLKYSKLIPCNCPTCKDSQSPFFYPFERLRKFIADQQYTIQCQESYQMVNVLSLLDDIIGLNQLISNDQQDINKSIQVKGDIQQLFLLLSQQGNIYGDFSEIMANSNDESSKINISGSGNISGNAKVTSSSAGWFNLGDISGKVTNTINQLPSFDGEPESDKKQLKELLSQLQSAVLAEDLDDDDKAEALEQIEDIASALTNSEDSTVKKIANKAMKMLIRT